MKVYERLDKIDACLQKIDQTLVRQEEAFKLHGYRVELAEKKINVLECDMKPIGSHVKKTEGALKLLGVLALVSTVITTIYRVIQ